MTFPLAFQDRLLACRHRGHFHLSWTLNRIQKDHSNHFVTNPLNQRYFTHPSRIDKSYTRTKIPKSFWTQWILLRTCPLLLRLTRLARMNLLDHLNQSSNLGTTKFRGQSDRRIPKGWLSKYLWQPRRPRDRNWCTKCLSSTTMAIVWSTWELTQRLP